MLIEFSMFPIGKGESLSDHVAGSLDIIAKSGLPYHLSPMGTTIEGEWDELMAVVKKCFETMNKNCDRINCSIKMDWRKGRSGQIGHKIEVLEKKLGRKLTI